MYTFDNVDCTLPIVGKGARLCLYRLEVVLQSLFDNGLDHRIQSVGLCHCRVIHITKSSDWWTVYTKVCIYVYSLISSAVL